MSDPCNKLAFWWLVLSMLLGVNAPWPPIMTFDSSTGGVHLRTAFFTLEEHQCALHATIGCLTAIVLAAAYLPLPDTVCSHCCAVHALPLPGS